MITFEDVSVAYSRATDPGVLASPVLDGVNLHIAEGDLALVKTYRAALRALPEQSGAPWDGGGDETPWPEAPGILQTEQPCA